VGFKLSSDSLLKALPSRTEEIPAGISAADLVNASFLILFYLLLRDWLYSVQMRDFALLDLLYGDKEPPVNRLWIRSAEVLCVLLRVLIRGLLSAYCRSLFTSIVVALLLFV
jgi:hypothetical protein